MADAGALSFRTAGECGLAIISPNDPGAMMQYAEECRTLAIPYIFDPGQQCTSMSGDELKNGIVGAHLVICNDYEFELIRQKTGFAEPDVLQEANGLIVTRGEHGSSVFTARGGRIDVPAVAPRRVVDPTGVGDAFRGGLMKGIALGVPYETAARIGSVAATYALEHLGGQSHSYTWREFAGRYEEHFGALTGAP
jgi:adenosine kinase